MRLVTSSGDLPSLEDDSGSLEAGMSGVGQRVKQALKLRGVSAAKLAMHLGITRSAVSQWWQPVPTRPTEERLEAVAQFLNVDFEWLKTGEGSPEHMLTGQPADPPRKISDSTTKIYTLGAVGAGVFLPVKEFSDLSFDKEESAFPPIPAYPIEDQYDLIVRGTSVERFANDGERVRCVKVDAIGYHSGDLVHVERYRFGRSEVENTIKQIRYTNGRWELHYYSNDPRWDRAPPLLLGEGDDVAVEIRGVALFKFAPSPSRRR